MSHVYSNYIYNNMHACGPEISVLEMKCQKPKLCNFFLCVNWLFIIAILVIGVMVGKNHVRRVGSRSLDRFRWYNLHLNLAITATLTHGQGNWTCDQSLFLAKHEHRHTNHDRNFLETNTDFWRFLYICLCVHITGCWWTSTCKQRTQWKRHAWNDGHECDQQQESLHDAFYSLE